jgi:hypothetical protein
MKNDIFRPAGFWKSACITMPDSSFFELLRSVFGKIKTPFNKQQLLNDLETFLLREDIQKTIVSYIDEMDAKIICAVALFGEPVPAQLEDFFCDELSPAQLQDIIVNLEERFILYRFTEEKTTRLALNPVLKPVLLPITTNSSVLFPAVQQSKISAAIAAPKPHLTELIIAGLFSYAIRQEMFFRPDGAIRKRVIEEAKTVFPGIDLKNIIGALQVIGLFYADGERLIPDKKYFDDFVSLLSHERMEFCAAALLVYNELTPPYEILPPLFRNKIRETVNLIHSFMNSLKPEFQYQNKTLRRMIEVIKSRTNTIVNTEKLLEALEKTGLLHMERAGRKSSPVIAIDSGSSILVYPEINFEDVIKLASVLNIREASTVVGFELNKESAVRAFDNNINADEIIELLNRLSGERVEDTLIWNLKEWEKRHTEVSLKKGIVLKLSQEHHYLTKTNPIASLIMETLAPGVYMLNENTMDDAMGALKRAGIDIVAQCKDVQKQQGKPLFASNNFPSPSSSSSLSLMDSDTEGSAYLCVNSSGIKSNFHVILEKLQLSDQERAELSARIDRRLIICETQLKDANIRFEKHEARLMDYTGKQHIAKQAISQKSPVEIVYTNKGEEKRIFGTPSALEKEGNELFLVIDSMRLPLAKISLLRRIKKSIFEK